MRIIVVVALAFAVLIQLPGAAQDPESLPSLRQALLESYESMEAAKAKFKAAEKAFEVVEANERAKSVELLTKTPPRHFGLGRQGAVSYTLEPTFRPIPAFDRHDQAWPPEAVDEQIVGCLYKIGSSIAVWTNRTGADGSDKRLLQQILGILQTTQPTLQKAQHGRCMTVVHRAPEALVEWIRAG